MEQLFGAFYYALPGLVIAIVIGYVLARAVRHEDKHQR